MAGHCTYRAPEQWAHSTGISFLAVDGTETPDHAHRFVDTLGRSYTGQLSFDYVDHDGELFAIECNPRTDAGWRDAAPMLWAPASWCTGARLSRGEREVVLAATLQQSTRRGCEP